MFHTTLTDTVLMCDIRTHYPVLLYCTYYSVSYTNSFSTIIVRKNPTHRRHLSIDKLLICLSIEHDAIKLITVFERF